MSKFNAKDFRLQVERDAAAYLITMVGEKRGREAAARVGMAFAATARSAKKPQALYDCSRASIVAAIANCALTGLMPGGAHPKVWLIPKGGELQWWMSHRGIAVLALRAGYQLRAVPVMAEDHILVEFGDVVEHDADPDVWPSNLDDLRGVYLQVRRISDRVVLDRLWMPIDAVKKRRAKALTQSVWREWPIEQAQKTVIKWAMARGFLPIDSEDLDLAMEAEPQFIDITPTASTTSRPTGIDALGVGDEDTPQLEDRKKERDLEDADFGMDDEKPEPVKLKAKPEPEAERQDGPPNYDHNYDAPA